LKEMPKSRAWILAIRPRTLTAAAARLLLGTGLAIGHGEFRLLPALAALAGSFLIQIGTNLANDYYDFVRGGDTEDRVGPARVTQAGVFKPDTVRNAAFGVLGLALIPGIYLVAVGGIPILLIGIASLVCAVTYTAGPFPLAYNGLGDLFVFVFFGLVAVGGTYWVQALAFGPEALVAGAGMGAMATAILVVNNLRDIETDAMAGKRTLAVRVGPIWTKREYFLLAGLAMLVPSLGIPWFGWGWWVLAGPAAVLLLEEPAKVILAFSQWDDPNVLIPPLEGTARAAGLYGLLLGVALAVG